MSHPDRFESLIEARIREAEQNGEFDNLPGQGKPIPGRGEPYDEDWWIKSYLRREGVDGAASLPPSLQLALDIERLPDRLRGLGSEQRVRAMVAEINERIGAYRAHPTQPYVTVHPVDAERMLRLWRKRGVPRREPPDGRPEKST